MADTFEEKMMYYNSKHQSVYVPEGITDIELIFMRDRYVAFTDMGVYEIKNGYLTKLILDVEFGAGDVFDTWLLEVSYHLFHDGKCEWKSYDTDRIEESPEFLLPSNFYSVLADLEGAYPNQKNVVLDVLLAICGARKYYADWDAEACWKRVLTYYTLDQMEVAA